MTPITREESKKKIAGLVERFERNFESYKNAAYNETQARREFIDPLFKALGWDIDNEQGIAEAKRAGELLQDALLRDPPYGAHVSLTLEKATSREEIGNPPHYGTVNKLREEHIPLVPHHAKQITWKDYERADYIIGMDTANIRNLNRMLKNDPDGKVYKFLSFTGSGRDIADPWYTGDFEATYRDVVEGCNGFLAYLRREGKI